MHLNDYQTLAARTIPANLTGDRLFLNAILGLNGESGELGEVVLLALGLGVLTGRLADQYKKAGFQQHTFDIDKAISELGDILWYVGAASGALGMTLEDVAARNIAKLVQRYPEGFSAERSLNRDNE